MQPRPGLAAEVDRRIDQQLRFAAVERNEGDHADFGIGNPRGSQVAFQKGRELAEHLGIAGHPRDLVRRQVVPRIDSRLLPGLWILGDKLHNGGLLIQHHPPGELRSLFRPVHIAGVEEVAKGDEELEEDVERHKDGKEGRGLGARVWGQTI